MTRGSGLRGSRLRTTSGGKFDGRETTTTLTSGREGFEAVRPPLDYPNAFVNTSPTAWVHPFKVGRTTRGVTPPDS